MMADDWLGLQPPTTCGKRPRSPVDKLADLAASAEDDEQDWRSSKRYLTEVIANGFSRLSFKRATQQQQQQQQPPTQQQSQQQQQHLLQQPSGAQQQQPPSSTPMPSGVQPGQLLIGAPPLQLPDADCPMDTQVSPPTWPPQLKHPLQTPAFQSASPSSPAGGVFSGGWLQDVHSSGRQGTAAQAGVRHSSTPSPESGSRSAQHSATVSRRIAAAAAAPAVAGGGAAAAAAACAGGPEAGPGEAKSGLPPLQTAKVLRAAEKQPNSPSDLPAASLRKVALLRSLLARAEQQFHQQHGGSQHQQQQQHPTRMQQPPAALFGSESATAQQQLPASDAHSKAPWVQPWGASCMGSAALQHHQQQLSALPPRPVTPWELSSDDMDCSSASSVVDSEGSSSQQGLQEAAGPPAARSQQDQAASALLCDEVLFPALEQKGSEGWQQAPQHNQQQQQRFGCRGRDAVQLPFFNQAAVEPVFGPPGCAAAAASCPALHPQHQLGTSHGTDASTSQQQQHSHCQQQQQQQQPPDGLCECQCSLELSRQALEALRARALASTNQLTCLTQEDLHSLQLGLTSRRGSCDSHTPSGLHEATRPPTPPALRRHSSHI